MKKKHEKNVPDWLPTEKDYSLVFMCVDGMWREVSANLIKYSGILLCDYLTQMQIVIPDFCQFCRIINYPLHFEYRSYGGRVIINVHYADSDK